MKLPQIQILISATCCSKVKNASPPAKVDEKAPTDEKKGAAATSETTSDGYETA